MSAAEEQRHPSSLEKGPYSYRGDDLIVSLPHERLVKGQLKELGVEIDETKTRRSDILGLARVRLDNLKSATDQVREAAEAKAPGGAVSSRRPGPAASPLDTILWGLRVLIGAQYDGWTPTIGKNRILDQVVGSGQVIHLPPRPRPRPRVRRSGDEDPTPIPPVELPVRASGPGRGVRVGVIDTRLVPQPWLAGGWTARFSDIGPATPPYSPEGHATFVVPEGHATFVTGLILSQAPGATVEVRGILDKEGQADSWAVAEEIVRFARSGLDVLNLSFGCYTEDGEAPLVLAAAINGLDPDLVVVAAAGNHAEQAGSKPAWPAALERVIGVGAARPDGARADFSPEAPWVDIHALGVGVRSTYLSGPVGSTLWTEQEQPATFDGWASWSGTSFAAALVSGAIAAGAEPGRITAAEAWADIVRSLGNGSSTPEDDAPQQARVAFLNLPPPFPEAEKHQGGS